MLITCQIPLADARPFLIGNTHKLAAPNWPNAIPGTEFIRSFGPVRPRRRGGDKLWSGEGVYCDASRALRLPSMSAKDSAQSSVPGNSLNCEFRRYFSDGVALSRLEVGFSRRFTSRQPHADEHSQEENDEPFLPKRIRTRQGWRTQTAPPLDGVGCLRLLTDCMSIRTQLPSNEPGTFHELLTVDRPLAAHILRSTTSTRRDADPPGWWISSGQPVYYVQYFNHEVAGLPQLSKPVEVEGLSRLQLSHAAIWRHDRLVSIWFVEVSQNIDLDVARRLRICLLRLHAERQCLKLILRHITQGRIPIERGTEAGDRLQRYLSKSFSVFFAKQRFGIAQSEILASAYSYDALVSQDEGDALANQLRHVRRSVSMKVSNGLKSAAKREELAQTASYYIVDSPGVIIVDKRVQVGDVHAPITGVIGADNSVQNSFNTIQESSASEGTKEHLKALADAVAAMCRELPEDKAKVAARDLEMFTQEATSENPRRSVLEALGNGLKETAAAVSAVGPGVASLVHEVIKLF